MKRLALLLICLTTLSFSYADEVFPKVDWSNQPDPIASVDAVVGGEISLFVSQYPKSFNYYLENNVFCAYLFGFLFDSLLSSNSITLEDEPSIAEKWSISEDKKVFTFWIDKRARWSDGVAITAEDVKFTYDVLMDKNNLTGVHKVSLERFTPPIVLDKHQIKFIAKEVHWANLNAIGGLNILPKHVMANKDFNKINFEFPVISGSYQLGKVKEGIYAKVERRKDWWQRGQKRYQNTGNFSTIKFRFFDQRENAFEVFKKGEIDIYPVYTSRIWMNETKGQKFDNNWIVKQRIYNYDPVGFQGWVMNTRRELFKDIRVRKALAHLIDREKMNKTLMYSQYQMHKSYYEDLYSKEKPCPNPYFEFSLEKARALLKDAGWKANPSSGILEKNGQEFRFKMLARSTSAQKFYTIYMEALKDVGIIMEIDQKDWATWSKDMDEYNFDVTWAAWGAGVFKNPEGMWHSKEATRTSGNNYAGVKNKAIDDLIEAQKSIFDVKKRHDIVRKIDQILTKDQVPYILLWYAPYTRLLYWNKFGMPDTVLSKYGSELSTLTYWWYDEDQNAELDYAMKEGQAQPQKPENIYFDKQFVTPKTSPSPEMKE